MEFLVGCNYWASHAGTDMWAQWDAERIEKDFQILKENNVNALRVFINWRDFVRFFCIYCVGFSVFVYVL